jgi:hypothetical protein
LGSLETGTGRTAGDGLSNESETSEAEQTLRLLAGLPAPTGLEDRVHASLLAAPRRARVLQWPASPHSSSGWLRGAAAAAIVLVVAGGSWGVYSRVAPGQPAKGVSGPHIAGPGEFSQGGAVRRPLTLQGPVVAPKQDPAVAHPETTPKPKAKSATNAAKMGKDAPAVHFVRQ